MDNVTKAKVANRVDFLIVKGINVLKHVRNALIKRRTLDSFTKSSNFVTLTIKTWYVN